MSNSQDNISFIKYNATPQEVSQLQSICKTWEQDTGFWSFDEILKTISEHKNILIYCYNQNDKKKHWIGCILGILLVDVCEIIYIYVRKRHRNKNIGIGLMNALFNELKQEPYIKKICLEVRKSNVIAQSLYLKLGFINIGIRKKYYSNGEDAILFTKIITELQV